MPENGYEKLHVKNEPVKNITDYMNLYFESKPPDCNLYVGCGYKFEIHRVSLFLVFSCRPYAVAALGETFP